MAAWIVVALMGGVVVGWLIADYRQFRGREVERRLDEMRVAMQPRDGDQAMLDRVLDRLLAAVVPEVREETVSRPPTTESPGEYEEPEVPVMDWTDPFIGLERPVVARLAPGEQIPGFDVDDERPVDPVEAWREMGEGSFEEWVRETAVPDGLDDDQAWSTPAVGWVEPIDFGEEQG